MRARFGRNFSRALLLAGLTLLSACASKQESINCAQRDWYEIGRRDGSQGATLDRKDSYKKECGGEFDGHYATIYENGRNAGLVEFCQPDNAFQLGRMGIAYMYVCPSTMETPFLVSYRKGQQARLLEMKKKDIDAQIDSLSQRVQALAESSFERRQLISKLDELRKLRAANDKELDKISK